MGRRKSLAAGAAAVQLRCSCGTADCGTELRPGRRRLLRRRRRRCRGPVHPGAFTEEEDAQCVMLVEEAMQA